MTNPSRRPASEAGFSLIEMLIAMVVLSFVMGAAISVMRSQSRNFRRGGTRMELTQNMRYATSTVDRVVRTLGAGIGTNQPMLVYGGNDVIVFNADYASDIPDGVAVYVNPSLPAAANLSMTTGTTITLPNVAPTITYPVANYFWGGATPSRAETISFYFRPDSQSPDPNDFVLLEKVNAMRAELVARGIRAYPGRQFFEYWWDSTATSGVTTNLQLAAAKIPIRHTAIGGLTSRSDSIRGVRINMVVTNGDLTIDSTSRRISTMMQIPNNGLTQLSTCGDVPLPTGVLVADTIPQASGGVNLTWAASPDELGGERDISQYNVYYRLSVGPVVWTPFFTQSSGFSPYNQIGHAGLTPGASYFFAVAAQDCSPAESAFMLTPATVVHN
jgi:prepilin-type N-terminal cleavage/methylation domain-containing protein